MTFAALDHVHITSGVYGVAGRPISAPWTQRVSVRALLRASVSRPGRCPQATPGYSSKAAAWHGAPHNGADACYAGLHQLRGRQLRRRALGHLDGLGIFLVDRLRANASPGGDPRPTVTSLA